MGSIIYLMLPISYLLYSTLRPFFFDLRDFNTLGGIFIYLSENKALKLKFSKIKLALYNFVFL